MFNFEQNLLFILRGFVKPMLETVNYDFTIETVLKENSIFKLKIKNFSVSMNIKVFQLNPFHPPNTSHLPQYFSRDSYRPKSYHEAHNIF
jgi:hypothetical protein